MLDFDNLQAADLLKACTALEVVTQNRKDGDASKFTWQRNGDLRYSFLHWVDRPQVAGPLGYGPSSAGSGDRRDRLGGRLHLWRRARHVREVRDRQRPPGQRQLSTDDLLSGKTISDVLQESAAAARPARRRR